MKNQNVVKLVNDSSFDVLNISGVRCYCENDTAYLDLEAVCRGLGFVQYKNDVQYVRWTYVRKTLQEFGFSQPVGKGTFIPENMFYRLALMANNPAAKSFQEKVANEIIPSIRKHGLYATDETLQKLIDDPEFGIRLLTELKKEREHRKALEEKIEEDAPLVDFAHTVSDSEGAITINEFAKIITNKTGVDMGQNRLYKWLRVHKFLMYTKFNIPYQKYINNGWFIVKQITGESNGSTYTYRQTRVTGEGQLALYKLIAEDLCKSA